VRVSGGKNDISSTGQNVLPSGAVQTAASKVDTQYQGIQAGFDSGTLNLGGSLWNVHLGVMGGEIMAHSAEKLGPGTLNFKVPFAGIYAVATRGGFYADVTVRRDFFDIDVTNNTVGLSGTQLRGTGTNVNASAGYHQDLGNNVFAELSGGVSWTRSSYSALAITGGMLDFDPVKSLLARVGIRVGTSFNVADLVTLVPFASFSAWNEFEKSAGATATLAGSVIPLTTTRVGTFYQGSAGLSFQVPNTGFLGFIRGDVRYGENIQGWTGLAGLRYTFGPL
jgi:outer membrane autotransporter protein